MPIPTPRKGEREKHFISRAIKTLAKEGKRYTQKQRVAIAYEQWRNR
jgi:hypothetical protein